MATIEMHANRNLRPRVLSDGSRRGIKQIFAFGHGARPVWWNETAPPVKGSVVGVYENRDGSPEDALVIGEEGLTILRERGATWIRFDDIEELVPPRKDQLPRKLDVRLRSAGGVGIPFLSPGAAFDFYLFLLSAVDEFR